MAANDTPWYELIGQRTGASVNKMVKCDTYATAISLKELADVAIYCVVPITQAAYQVTDRQENTVKEGTHTFPEGGVERFVLKDMLPLEELKPYETESAHYRLSLSVTLVSGDQVNSPFTFACYLHSGETTTQLPVSDLRAQLAAIPVAHSGMTAEQLRQICLDYIKLEAEIPIKFKEDFNYVIQSQERPRKLIGGKIYGGIPYVTRGAGNLYRYAEIYDPATGTLDAGSDIFDNIRYFGNACSGGASMAWARVVTSAYLGYTMFMCNGNGFLPVGPYKYQEGITVFNKVDPDGTCPKNICPANGPQTMYESYAMMLPADGVVCNGHVRMNSAVPVVVRSADGSIDGDQSYTLMREQVCYVSHHNHIRIAPDGSHYLAQGYVDMKYSFRTLFETGYIPFTFAEFHNPSLVEPARIRLAVEPALKERVLTANYPISDVFADLNGKRYTYRNMEFFRKEVKLGDIFPEEALTPETRISCQLYNGELLEVPQ